MKRLIAAILLTIVLWHLAPERVRWSLKQLLPLHYHTVFVEDGLPRLSIWRMWMGYSFNIKTYTLAH